MTLHTIMYRKNPAMSILEEMTKEGHGQFWLTLDGLQLVQSFQNLTKSLKPRVAALMLQNLKLPLFVQPADQEKYNNRENN